MGNIFTGGCHSFRGERKGMGICPSFAQHAPTQLLPGCSRSPVPTQVPHTPTLSVPHLVSVGPRGSWRNEQGEISQEVTTYLVMLMRGLSCITDLFNCDFISE